MSKPRSEGIKQGMKYFIQVFVIYILTSLLAYVFDMYSVHSENLLILYLLGVLIIIMETKNFLITTLSSVLFLVTHNFLFLDPRYTWVFYSRNFALSATVFFVVALIVNTLVVRLQKQITAAKKNEQLHKKLYEASQGLLKVHGKDRIVAYSDEALTKLAGAEVEFYFDIDKKMPVRIKDEYVAMYGHEEKLQMDYKPRKIMPPTTDGRKEESFMIKKSDLDTNGHVNNAKYVAMALEYVEEADKIKSMRVDYRKAAFYGDRIFPVVYEENNMTVVELQKEDGEIFVVVEFEKK